MEVVEQSDNRLIFKTNISAYSFAIELICIVVGLLILGGSSSGNASRIWGWLLLLVGAVMLATINIATLTIDKTAGQLIVKATYLGIIHRTRVVELSDMKSLRLRYLRNPKGPSAIVLTFIGDSKKLRFRSGTLHDTSGKKSMGVIPQNSQEAGYAQAISEFIGVPITTKASLIDSENNWKGLLGVTLWFVGGSVVAIIAIWLYQKIK